MKDVVKAVQILENFHLHNNLKKTISSLEMSVQGKNIVDINTLFKEGEIDKSPLTALYL